MKAWIVSKWASFKKALMQVLQNAVFILISIDQTLGMILGFIMHPASTELFPDETLSSRCGRLGHRHPYKFWRAVIDLMFLWQGPNHCENAYKKEKTLYHFHPSMRTPPESK